MPETEKKSKEVKNAKLSHAPHVNIKNGVIALVAVSLLALGSYFLFSNNDDNQEPKGEELTQQERLDPDGDGVIDNTELIRITEEAVDEENRFPVVLAVASSYYEEGDFQTALTKYKEAYSIQPEPYILLSIADSQVKLGLKDEAIDTYNQALEAYRSSEIGIDEDTEQAILNSIGELSE